MNARIIASDGPSNKFQAQETLNSARIRELLFLSEIEPYFRDEIMTMC